MPTSVPGSRRAATAGAPRRCRDAGFTLIELLVVLAIVAIASGLVTVALRDGVQLRLEEEGSRLAALLEAGRAEARASGVAVRWEPVAAQMGGDRSSFRFVGLPAEAALPTHWLREGTSAEIVGARAVVLGPEPILPAQRIVLRLEDRTMVLASDGLSPFAPANP